MKLAHLPLPVHLSYCTNIHAGDSLTEVEASLSEFVPAIRAHLEDLQVLGASEPFGLGLRLSAEAAECLLSEEALRAFAARLRSLNAYVFTINAFPWGNFHQKPVKQAVYQPDWRSHQRLDYTLHCARTLAALLPAGIKGSISTVPLGFDEGGRAAAMADSLPQLRQAVVGLHRLMRETGKEITLALEPEPACILENAGDALHFFQHYWFADDNLTQLARLAACSLDEARLLAHRHLGVCYDVCHGAVEFEDPCAALLELRKAGIRIAKIQLSCALQIDAMDPRTAVELQAFDDGVYLHQVVRRGAAGLQRHLDLPQALNQPPEVVEAEAWRVHCHVPLFWQAPAEGLTSTRASLDAVLGLLREEAVSPHLEVETYTWDVLPRQLREMPKARAISLELHAVLKALCHEQ
ncbi:metabolite traffic protein EboE [Jeongeupia naejangsanensis]|uniref:Metabolite traffic protein EboE n=1 Tax=Jeongeupia naejangsanensis TaxID=613195 RepID=A0ABS2BGX1_9NEIS|nr:metabolite traffic protein EboE [Jeongeupia naejangsanensis]MBM3114870.1 metabolite traffic protein EboE [Jeongeupia naejangsanensis]